MHSIPGKLTSEDTVSWQLRPATTPVISSGSESSNGSGGGSSSSSEDESFGENSGGGGTAEPHRDDVLLGRGKKHHTHPGNARFASTCIICARCSCLLLWYLVLNLFIVRLHAELVNQCRDEYFATINPLQKKALLQEIVSQILERGRFLKSNPNGGWDHVDQDRAILKTAHAIQYQRRKSVETAGSTNTRRPESPMSSSRSSAAAVAAVAAASPTLPRGPPFSAPHTVVTPQAMRTLLDISSWENDLIEANNTMLYSRDNVANHVRAAAERELLWTTQSSASPRDTWKQPLSYPHQHARSTITLRDACFLPQQQQQQHQQQRCWYTRRPSPQRVVSEAWHEPHPVDRVGSRDIGWASTMEVVALSSSNSTRPDNFVFDDCVEYDGRLCGNPFDEESFNQRRSDDDDMSSIGSFNDGDDDDALDLSLLGALDMHW
jgi:hypothetical protein